MPVTDCVVSGSLFEIDGKESLRAFFQSQWD